MNTTFNISRIGLLLKRHFIENKQKEFAFWGISLLVFTFLIRPESALMFLFIAGLVKASNSFKAFAYTPGGMHYLLIPATHFEKLVTAFILNVLYFFGMMIITSFIGNFIGKSVYVLIMELFPSWNLSVGNMYIHSFGDGLWKIFISFVIIQSIFTVGSLYFKRNAAAKTILCMAVFGLLIGLVELFLLKITFGTLSLEKQMFSLTFSSQFASNKDTFSILGEIIRYSLIPFFWIVSYFRLTEKQV